MEQRIAKEKEMDRRDNKRIQMEMDKEKANKGEEELQEKEEED